jgi:hypothetical protein
MQTKWKFSSHEHFHLPTEFRSNVHCRYNGNLRICIFWQIKRSISKMKQMVKSEIELHLP